MWGGESYVSLRFPSRSSTVRKSRLASGAARRRPPNLLARLRAGEPHLSLAGGGGDDAVPAVCGVSRSAPLGWRDRGAAACFSKGGRWYVFESDLEAFLAGDTAAPDESAGEVEEPTDLHAPEDAELAAAGW